MEIKENGSWIGTVANVHHATDEKLARALAAFFKGKSVIDLGCGNGYYTRYFREHGIEKADGVDGNPLTKSLSFGACSVQDLTQDFDMGKYDWTLCLEVGEHIPAEYEDVLINNMDKHNSEGIVLSWAVEGQSGVGHVNCHNNDYVIKKFKEKGYELNKPATEFLRENVSVCGWFLNTILVFRKL